MMITIKKNLAPGYYLNGYQLMYRNRNTEEDLIFFHFKQDKSV